MTQAVQHSDSCLHDRVGHPQLIYRDDLWRYSTRSLPWCCSTRPVPPQPGQPGPHCRVQRCGSHHCRWASSFPLTRLQWFTDEPWAHTTTKAPSQIGKKRKCPVINKPRWSTTLKEEGPQKKLTKPHAWSLLWLPEIRESEREHALRDETRMEPEVFSPRLI